MTRPHRAFGLRLLAAMRQREVTQADIVDATGIRPRRIQRLLNGDLPARLDEVPRLARVVGMSPAMLAWGRP